MVDGKLTIQGVTEGLGLNMDLGMDTSRSAGRGEAGGRCDLWDTEYQAGSCRLWKPPDRAVMGGGHVLREVHL